ncbi:MAG: glycosyltransferase [Gemmatimonadetes bacterium]|nr:glycosyltransferase [Gemmatimonadota bacterium]
MNVSVVVPLHNEEPNIERLLATVVPSLERNPLVDQFELICVDDGSTDGTAAMLGPHAAERVVLVARPARGGKSAALASGLGAARYDVIGLIDGDLQTSPDDFQLLLPMLAQGFDCAHGIRTNRQDSWVRLFSSRTARGVRHAILGDRFEDITCPLTVFRRECLEHVTLFEPFHRYLPFLIQAQGYRVTQVPVRHFPRTAGTAKYGIANRLGVGLVSLFVVRWLTRHQVTRDPGRHT